MTETLLHAFDAIRIINLPHRTDRRHAVTRELARAGLAVDGQRVRFVDAIRPDDAGAFPSVGARGCFLSHLETLRQARAEGVQRLLVLEDDVMFTRQLAHAGPLAAALLHGGWHLAYPGHAEAALPGPLRWVPTRDPLVCAHSVAIAGDALPVVIDYLESCLQRPAGHPAGGPMHYDGALTMLRRQRPDLVTLRASAALAVQRSSRSDIIGPSWLDRWPGAAALRALRSGWRRRAGAA